MTASRSQIITPICAALVLSFAATSSAQTPSSPPDLARQVEVRRTTHGVPHIRAENLKAAYYALAYVQLEDYGSRVAMGLLRARGEMGKWFGRDSMESDFGAQREYELAVENYPRLEQADARRVRGVRGRRESIRRAASAGVRGRASSRTSPATTSRRET